MHVRALSRIPVWEAEMLRKLVVLASALVFAATVGVSVSPVEAKHARHCFVHKNGKIKCKKIKHAKFKPAKFKFKKFKMK